MRPAQAAVLLVHAFVGWALCAAVMGVGMAVTTVQTTLYIHAVAAPVFFACVTLVYVRRFGVATPLQTASVFLAFVLAMDFFVVALLINRSLEMFASPLGTWIPFALIFSSTLVTARRVPYGKATAPTPAPRVRARLPHR
jgi:hypothetical protein